MLAIYTWEKRKENTEQVPYGILGCRSQFSSWLQCYRSLYIHTTSWIIYNEILRPVSPAIAGVHCKISIYTVEVIHIHKFCIIYVHRGYKLIISLQSISVSVHPLRLNFLIFSKEKILTNQIKMLYALNMNKIIFNIMLTLHGYKCLIFYNKKNLWRVKLLQENCMYMK